MKDLLDDFVSAYINNILIYSSGSRDNYIWKVRIIPERLRNAGLQVDIDKCKFIVYSTKYLGFILEAGKGVTIDPEKVKAI
jgi:hypothetical protein